MKQDLRQFRLLPGGPQETLPPAVVADGYHTQEDLDDTLAVLERVGKKYGLI